jgi:uncharacterized protein (TIGR00303 family)
LNLIEVHGKSDWIDKFAGKKPMFTCVLGFTSTGLIEGISAAGATPESRKFTAIADAEFLVAGKAEQFPLPTLISGVSPVFISRAILAALEVPILVFDAGLHLPPTVEHISLGGAIANCVSTGKALPIQVVKKLFNQGLSWGEKLSQQADYLILSECVVGGTTTALALLTALGFNAKNRVNSSHPICNHAQKWQLVQQGLSGFDLDRLKLDPLACVAAVGDPMQIVVAGMAIAASKNVGVILAGGTQMLAVYALAEALVESLNLTWKPENIVVGTTRWVAADPTGDTIGLAQDVGVTLLATQLSFADSLFPQLQAYERGFVKEGVGAGAAAIAATLYQDWSLEQMVKQIEQLISESNPTFGKFLNFLDEDLQNNLENIQPINSNLVERIQSLVEGVEIDLGSPLLEKDE